MALWLALSVPGPAWPAYELATPWAEIGGLDLSPAMSDPITVSDAAMYWPEFTPSHFRRALKDEDGRVSDEFRVPPHMEEHVRFWMRIYTFYSSQTLVIHDDRHPEVVYEVMDFRDLATEKSNPVVYEILRERKIESRIAAYREAFRELLRDPAPSTMTREMRNIVQAVAQSRHDHPLATYAERLRGQTGQRDIVLQGLRRADRFMPAMERLFALYQLPKELTRISLVESSFNTRAISRAGATGVWQFMPLSGKEYLTVSPETGVDERLSPLKATTAAARLLKRNHSIFGSWPLTVTSYNYGIRPLLRIRQEDRGFARIGDAFTRCDREYRFGFAGQNYYAEFLAMLHAERYRDLFFPSLSRSKRAPVTLAYRRLKNRMTGLQLAKALGISAMVFQEFNPDVRNLRAPLSPGFRYAVPSEETDIGEISGPAARLLSAGPAGSADT